jgi:hypothetical protein
MARTNHESGSTLGTALRAEYPLPQYALLFEVASGMGKTMNGYADAIAMGLFPSRGLDIEGFEFKVDRRDWLREMKDPAKAEHVAKYCDLWWLVIGDERVAKPEEVPSKWGLYVLKGRRLEVVKRPKKLRAVPPDRTFIGAMLRRANEMAERERCKVKDTLEFAEEVRQARAEGAREAQEHMKDDVAISTREHQSLKREVEAFEKASGIHINMWNGGKMGEAVKLVMSMKDHEIGMIERLAIDIEERSAGLKESARQLKEVGTSFASAGKIPT